MSNITIIRTKIRDLKRSIELERKDLKKFNTPPYSLTKEKEEDIIEGINIKKQRLRELRTYLVTGLINIKKR